MGCSLYEIIARVLVDVTDFSLDWVGGYDGC